MLACGRISSLTAHPPTGTWPEKVRVGERRANASLWDAALGVENVEFDQEAER